jgi:PAS domain-containing protein
MKRSQDSLQRRLLYLVVAAATAAALLAGGLGYLYEQERARVAAHSTVSDLIAAIARTAAIGAYTNDRVLLREVADGVVSHALVSAVEVRSPEGSVLQQAVSPSRASGDSGVALNHSPDELVHVLQSPFSRSESVGELRIQLDDGEIERRARFQALSMAWGMIVQTVLVAIVLYLATAKLVSTPIVRMARAVRAMLPSTANRVLTPPGHATDEIGVLASAINAMLQSSEDALRRERKLSADVRQMEQRASRISLIQSVGVFLLDGDGRLVDVNPVLIAMLDLANEDFEELKQQDFIGRFFENPAEVRALVGVAAEQQHVVVRDLRMKASGGAPLPVHCRLFSRRADPLEGFRGSVVVEGVVHPPFNLSTSQA